MLFMETLFFSVVKRGKANSVLRKAQKYGAEDGTIFLGEGTVQSKLLERVGLAKTYKEILMVSATDELSTKLHKKLGKDFHFTKKDKGITFSIPFQNRQLKNSEQEQDNWRKNPDSSHFCIITIVDKGRSKECLEVAKAAGAGGGTLIHGRGAGIPTDYYFPLVIEPEKDIIMIITPKEKVAAIRDSIFSELELDKTGNGVVFVLPVLETTGLFEDRYEERKGSDVITQILEKTQEVTRTLLPVVLLVLLLCFTIVDVETDIMLRFLVCSVILLIGLSIFLWGVDLAMNPIGEHLSWEVATSKTPLKIAVLSFMLGFLINVAEPDLLVLGSQIEAATGAAISGPIFVYIVSVGVGILVSLGVFRLLQDVPHSKFMGIVYSAILVLTFFASEEFLAFSFDASGATTGALTTPFILALSLGLSKVKGGQTREENSFGLVGIMSAGPMFAVIIMSIITGQKNIQAATVDFLAAEGVIGPILKIIPETFMVSLVAILPISTLFFIYNFKKFKLQKDELKEICKGLAFTLSGLVLFLVAVNSGFMDMGRIIGMEVAKMSQWLLIVVGFLLGLIVVLVEPAVHVLGEQVEKVTGGHIPISIIRATLSIGVALAVSLSMVRILVPVVKLRYFLVPGFAIAILLSFKSDPVFVGIAYDAGGVASGPMTATFVLAFAQGAATVIETANVLMDGFGVIAMVAMTPVLSIMILGNIFKRKEVKLPVLEVKEDLPPVLPAVDELEHNCIMGVVNRGFAEKVVAVARHSGATGATIIHGRGSGKHQKILPPVINIELQPEKEIVLLITGSHVSEQIADNLLKDIQLKKDGEIEIFISHTTAMVKTLTNTGE